MALNASLKAVSLKHRTGNGTTWDGKWVMHKTVLSKTPENLLRNTLWNASGNTTKNALDTRLHYLIHKDSNQRYLYHYIFYQNIHCTKYCNFT